MKKILKNGICFGLAFVSVFGGTSFVSSYDVKASEEGLEPQENGDENNQQNNDYNPFEELYGLFNLFNHNHGDNTPENLNNESNNEDNTDKNDCNKNQDCQKTTSYTVEYVDKDGQPLAESKTVTDQVVGTEVTEEAITIDGYTALDDSITVTLCKKCNNITFVYKKIHTTSYTVNYVDKDGNALADSKVVEDTEVGTEVTENAIDITGYTADQDSQTITLKKKCNEITFTYQKQCKSYVVKFVDEVTDKEIADEVKVDNVEFETVISVSDYNTKSIEGYTYTKDSGDLTISADESENVITIYYKKNIKKATDTSVNTNMTMYAGLLLAAVFGLFIVFANKFKKINK